MQGDGYVYLELRIIDNEEYVSVREKTTTLKIEEGWNYLSVDLDEIYEYSYVTMHHRSENQQLEVYKTTFNGYYKESKDDEA